MINFKKDFELLILLPNFKFGGAERLLIDLANKKKNDYKVSILVANHLGELSNLVSKDILVRSPRIGGYIGFLWELIKILHSRKKIHIFTSMYHMNLIACFVKYCIFDIELTIRESTSIYFYAENFPKVKFSIFKSLASILYPVADNIIFPSNCMFKLFKTVLNFDKNNCKVVPNPVSQDEILNLSNDIITDETWIKGSNTKIISVGRMDKNKNQILILKSLVELRGKDFSFYFIGDGPEAENLKKFVTENNLTKHVSFLGFKENPFPYIKNCSVLILSSINEGYPNVLVQGRFLDINIISTDCPTGPREILEGYGKAEIVDFEINSMTKAIKRCIE